MRVDKRENSTPLTEEQKTFGEANHRLAFSILQKYSQTTPFVEIVGWDEARSAAGIALVRVLRAYKPELKRRLSASLNRAIFRELRLQALKKRRYDAVSSLGDKEWKFPASGGEDLLDTLSIEEMMNRLLDRERAVLKLYYGLGGTERANFRQIGILMGFTGTTARKIHDKALTKLRVLQCT